MSEKRDAYVKKLKALLDEWNADIDKLSAKTDKADADAKIEYHKKLDELKEKRSEIEHKIEVMQESGESAWEDLKHGLEDSWDTLKKSLSMMKSEFEKGYKEGMRD